MDRTIERRAPDDERALAEHLQEGNLAQRRGRDALFLHLMARGEAGRGMRTGERARRTRFFFARRLSSETTPSGAVRARSRVTKPRGAFVDTQRTRIAREPRCARRAAARARASRGRTPRDENHRSRLGTKKTAAPPPAPRAATPRATRESARE
eukprot:31039-Pelagococcus_subviridis.AAC.5